MIIEQHVRQLQKIDQVSIRDVNAPMYSWYLTNENGVITIGYGLFKRHLECGSLVVDFSRDDMAIIIHKIEVGMLEAKDYFEEQITSVNMNHYYAAQ